jgi:hypothetical protein
MAPFFKSVVFFAVLLLVADRAESGDIRAVSAHMLKFMHETRPAHLP